MRALLTGLAVAVSLLLGGCYMSTPLLLDSRSPATPLQPGVYTYLTKPTYSVAFDRGSWYRVHRYDSKGQLIKDLGAAVLLNRWAELDSEDVRVYAVAMKFSDGYAYGVLGVDKYNRVTFDKPNCSNRRERELGQAQGATVQDMKTEKGCVFTSAEQLKTALAEGYRERLFWRQGLRRQ